MQKKLRTRLEMGRPVFLVDASKEAPDLLKCIELIDFNATHGSINWSVKCGDGQIITGKVRDQQPIPFLKDSWITLAIPIKLHIKQKCFAPDFIVFIPGSYQLVYELRSLRK